MIFSMQQGRHIPSPLVSQSLQVCALSCPGLQPIRTLKALGCMHTQCCARSFKVAVELPCYRGALVENQHKKGNHQEDEPSKIEHLCLAASNSPLTTNMDGRTRKAGWEGVPSRSRMQPGP